jgi:hypothetical protein
MLTNLGKFCLKIIITRFDLLCKPRDKVFIITEATKIYITVLFYLLKCLVVIFKFIYRDFNRC